MSPSSYRKQTQHCCCCLSYHRPARKTGHTVSRRTRDHERSEYHLSIAAKATIPASTRTQRHRTLYQSCTEFFAYGAVQNTDCDTWCLTRRSNQNPKNWSNIPIGALTLRFKLACATALGPAAPSSCSGVGCSFTKKEKLISEQTTGGANDAWRVFPCGCN